MKDKVTHIIATIALLLLFIGGIWESWSWFNLQNDITRINAENERLDARNQNWINLVDSIYSLGDTSLSSSQLVIRDLLQIYRQDTQRLADLYFIKGNIEYQKDQIDEAINSLSTSKIFSKAETPKHLALMGGCLVKKGDFDIAKQYLALASQKNHSYKWHLGNFFEIIGDKNKAIQEYAELLQKDSITYRICRQRLTELEKENPQFLNSIQYDDDRNRIFLKRGKLHIDI